MKINKTMAEGASNLMADKVYEGRFNSMHSRIVFLFESIVRKHIPLEVRKILKQYPEIIRSTMNVYYYYNGEYYYEDITNPVPMSKRNVRDLCDDDERTEVRNLILQFIKLKMEKETFKAKCVEQLRALSTKKRIEVSFPEAIPFITWPSEPTQNLPSVMLTDIRTQLQLLK